MAEMFFDADKKEMRQWIKRCQGDFDDVDDDVKMDWFEEPFEDSEEFGQEEPLEEPIEDNIEIAARNLLNSTKDQFSKEEQAYVDRARVLLKRLNTRDETSLQINVKRIRNEFFVSFAHPTIEEVKGVDKTRLQAFRKAYEAFESSCLEQHLPKQSSDSRLAGMDENLRSFCNYNRLEIPKFTTTKHKEIYSVTVSVNGLLETGNGVQKHEAYCSAAKLWLDIHGGNWKKVLQDGRERDSNRSNIFSEDDTAEKETAAHKTFTEKSNSSLMDSFDEILMSEYKNVDESIGNRVKDVERNKAALPRNHVKSFDLSSEQDYKEYFELENIGQKRDILSNISSEVSNGSESKCASLGSDSESGSPLSSARSSKLSETKENARTIDDSERKKSKFSFGEIEVISAEKKRSKLKQGNRKDKKPLFKSSRQDNKTENNARESSGAFDYVEDSSLEKLRIKFSKESAADGKKRKPNIEQQDACDSGASNIIEKGVLDRIDGDKFSETKNVQPRYFEDSEAFDYEEDLSLEKLRSKFEKKDAMSQGKREKNIGRHSLNECENDATKKESIAENYSSTKVMINRKRNRNQTETSEHNNKQSKISRYFTTKPELARIEVNQSIRCVEEDRQYSEKQEIYLQLEQRIQHEQEALERERRKEEKFREFTEENKIFRDRLHIELDEKKVRELIRNNIDYLQSIKDGQLKSERHEEYLKGGGSRRHLVYRLITDPYTDDQLTWTLDELSKVWLRNDEEKRMNSDYMWKVLISECFIKLYMDHFSMDRKEAEFRIQNTPLLAEHDFSLRSSSSKEN